MILEDLKSTIVKEVVRAVIIVTVTVLVLVFTR